MSFAPPAAHLILSHLPLHCPPLTLPLVPPHLFRSAADPNKVHDHLDQMLHEQAKQLKAKADFDREMHAKYGDYEPHASRTAAEREEVRVAGIAELVDCHRDCDAPWLQSWDHPNFRHASAGSDEE